MSDLKAFPLAVILVFLLHLGAGASPRVSIVSGPPNPERYAKTTYPWKKNITATVFWIGERPTSRNPTPNHKSSWDQQWQENYGGFDNPDKKARRGYLPKNFTPKLNPFYVALPYNDCLNWKRHKREASRVIPWFKRSKPRPGRTCLKGRWLQIYNPKTRRFCYAQWEDCGPFVTDDYRYVFGNARPKNRHNKGAGIDLSPAVRDHLKMGNMGTVHWRFIEFSQVPKSGPWTKWGTNNPFKNPEFDPDRQARLAYFEHLRKQRDAAYLKRDIRRSR